VSPGGRQILSTGSEASVRLTDARTGDRLACFRLPQGTLGSAVALSPDLRLAAVGIGSCLELWDLDAGCLTWRVRDPRVVYTIALRFSADGSCLHSLSSGLGEADREVAKGEARPGGADGLVAVFRYSETGRTLRAFLHGHTRPVATGEILARWIVEQEMSAAISGDGRALLLGMHGGAAVMDPLTLRTRAHFALHRAPVLAVGLSADGSLAISGDLGGCLHIWKTATGQEVKAVNWTSPVRDVALSDDGRWFAAGLEDGTLLTGSNESGSAPAAHRALARMWPLTEVGVSADGRIVVVGDEKGFIQVWERTL